MTKSFELRRVRYVGTDRSQLRLQLLRTAPVESLDFVQMNGGGGGGWPACSAATNGWYFNSGYGWWRCGYNPFYGWIWVPV